MGVSFLFGDTPLNLKQQILASPIMYMKVCKDHCASYGICSEQTMTNCPKFTEQTRYICKYLAQQSQFSPTIYPHPGTWQDQPEWYLIAYNIGSTKLNELRSNK